MRVALLYGLMLAVLLVGLPLWSRLKYLKKLLQTFMAHT